MTLSEILLTITMSICFALALIEHKRAEHEIAHPRIQMEMKQVNLKPVTLESRQRFSQEMIFHDEFIGSQMVSGTIRHLLNELVDRRDLFRVTSAMDNITNQVVVRARLYVVPYGEIEKYGLEGYKDEQRDDCQA